MAFTYFFRDKQILDLMAQYVIPELKTRMYLTVWDAGCANGPEPYSIAITFRENMGHFLFRNVRIYATDIDEGGDFGATIERGVFPEEMVKRIPPDIFAKYFEPVVCHCESRRDEAISPCPKEIASSARSASLLAMTGQDDNGERAFQVKDELRQAVRYQKHNLLSLQPIREGFGLIVCKNVLLHFEPEARAEVVKMFHRALSEGGYFVTEQTQKLPPGTEHLFRQVTQAGQVFQKVTSEA